VLLRFHSTGFLIAVLICVLTLYPGDELPECYLYGNLSFDKVVHVFLFMLLSVSNLAGFTKQYKYRGFRFKPKYFVVISCTFLALATELFQSLVRFRTMELTDFLANLTGVLLGFLLFRLIYGKELWRA